MSEQKAPPANSVTYEEFLEWVDEKTRAEWVNGEVVMLSPVSLPHAQISMFLVRLMGDFVETRDLGTLIHAPFQMHLPNLDRGREPDILFVAKENLHRFTKTYLEGPADLVVEIVSPDSKLRDRGEKFAEYEIEGVRPA